MSGSSRLKKLATARQLLENFGEEVKEGTFIPAEVVERTVGLKRDTVQYGFELMQLKEPLREVLCEKNGRPFLVKQAESGFEVVPNNEVGDYIFARFKSKQRSMQYLYLLGQEVLDDHLDTLTVQERDAWLQQRSYMRKILLSQAQLDLNNEPSD